MCAPNGSGCSMPRPNTIQKTAASVRVLLRRSPTSSNNAGMTLLMREREWEWEWECTTGVHSEKKRRKQVDSCRSAH
jgi:hypothetical protein